MSHKECPVRSHQNDPPKANPSRLIELLQLDCWFPIASRIGDFLSITDIINVTRTCKFLSNLYRSLLPHKWDVDRALKPFVDDPKGFRSHLGRCDALVSGSFALQFFMRTLWPDSDLDIFVKHGSRSTDMERFVLDFEGYTLSNVVDGDNYASKASQIVQIYTYIKQNAKTGSMMKLQIIATTDMPIVNILGNFYTTAVVNFVTWNKAYSIYPEATFGQRRLYMHKPISSQSCIASFIKKYEGRGWIFNDERSWRLDMHGSDEEKCFPFGGSRSIADEYSWVIPFCTDLVQRPSVPDAVLEQSHFNLSRGLLRREMFDNKLIAYYYFEIDVYLFRASTLKYQYACGPVWKSWLAKIMDYRALDELHKMATDSRPEDFNRLIEAPEYLHRKLHFARPHTWTYYDDDMPGLYRQWRETFVRPSR